jgi:hypothetical protein
LRPLLRWATTGFGDRSLAIDPTNLGDRFTGLAAVAFRGRARPATW